MAMPSQLPRSRMPRAEATRRSGWTPPWMMGKRDWRGGMMSVAAIVGCHGWGAGWNFEVGGGPSALARDPIELDPAAIQPSQAPLHRRLTRRKLRLPCDQLVELHDHISADIALDPHHAFRRVVVLRAIDMALKDHALLAHLSQSGERKHLKTARVGQHRAVPPRERVQSAECADHHVAWPQVEVIRIGQDHLPPGGCDLLDAQPLDRAMRADRHERRRLHHAVGRREPAETRAAGVVGGAEREIGHAAEEGVANASCGASRENYSVRGAPRVHVRRPAFGNIESVGQVWALCCTGRRHRCSRGSGAHRALSRLFTRVRRASGAVTTVHASPARIGRCHDCSRESGAHRALSPLFTRGPRGTRGRATDAGTALATRCSHSRLQLRFPASSAVPA